MWHHRSHCSIIVCLLGHLCFICSVYACKLTQYSQCEMDGFVESNAGACVQTQAVLPQCIDPSTGQVAVSFTHDDHIMFRLYSPADEPTPNCLNWTPFVLGKLLRTKLRSRTDKSGRGRYAHLLFDTNLPLLKETLVWCLHNSSGDHFNMWMHLMWSRNDRRRHHC